MRNDLLRPRSRLSGGACAFAFVTAACGGGANVVIGNQVSDGGAESDVGSQPDSSTGSGEAASDMDAGDAASGLDAFASDSPASDSGWRESGGDSDGSVFDPGAVAGLVLWLDANKGVTQIGGAVSGWADQTSNHNDASQHTATLQPTFAASAIHSLPALHFNTDAVGMGNTGTGDALSISDAPSLQWGTGDFYVVVVGDFDNTFADGDETGTGLLFAKLDSAPGPVLTANILGEITQTNQVGLGCLTSATAGDWVITNTPYNTGTPHAFAMQRTGAVLDLRVDGVSLGTSVSTDEDVSSAGTPVQIGAGTTGQLARLDGDIAEILAVEGTLSVSNRTAIESYLTTKYGL
jgi:hypothetical protein